MIRLIKVHVWCLKINFHLTFLCTALYHFQVPTNQPIKTDIFTGESHWCLWYIVWLSFVITWYGIMAHARHSVRICGQLVQLSGCIHPHQLSQLILRSNFLFYFLPKDINEVLFSRLLSLLLVQAFQWEVLWKVNNAILIQKWTILFGLKLMHFLVADFYFSFFRSYPLEH